MHHTSNIQMAASAIEAPPYRALGWMRFALAMIVVMNGHSAWLAPDNSFVQWLAWMRGGSIAVMVFFVISGYVITEAAATFYKGRPKAFATNRFLKIYPAYLAALALAILAHTIIYFDGKLLEGIAFEGYRQAPDLWDARNLLWQLFAVLPPFNHDVAADILGTSLYRFVRYIWAINVEVAFYLIVLGAICLIMRGHAATDRLVLKASITFAIAHLILLLVRRPDIATFYLQDAPAFALGALVWRWHRYQRRETLWALLVISASLAAHVGLSEKFISPGAHWTWRLLALAGLITVTIYFTRVQVGPVIRAIDRQLGDLTYAAYLNHYSVMILLSAYLAPDQRGTGYWLLNAALVILLSLVMHRLVEKPLAARRARVRGRELAGRQSHHNLTRIAPRSPLCPLHCREGRTRHHHWSG